MPRKPKLAPAIMRASLKVRLERLKLPTDLKQIIGRTFQFAISGGPNFELIAGTIISLDISENDSVVMLYVSCKQFQGKPLVRMQSDSNRSRLWYAVVENPSDHAFVPGELTLL